MNIKQIETFVRIVETGSFGAAAEVLHASQSTVSARIKDLERSLGVELFDRQSLPEDSHHHPVVKQWFRAAGVSMKPAVSCNNMHVLARLTMQGQGVSLLPRRAYAAEIAAGRLVVLDTQPAMVHVGFALVHRAERVPAMAALVAETARAVSDLPH